MRIALGQGSRATDEYLHFAGQLGLDAVQLNTPDIPGEKRWELADLVELRERCVSHGVALAAIENLPNGFYEGAMLGLPTRDEELENVCETIRNLGRAGIPMLGYNFMPKSVWRTSLGPAGRGGAVVSGFDLELALEPGNQSHILVARRDNRPRDAKDSWQEGDHLAEGAELSDDDMWRNYEYFAAAVMPVAEEAGVRLALHPDDPPVPSLGGVARIFRTVDALRRGAELAVSPAWAVELCIGTVSSMGGEQAVLDAIEHFGPRGQIGYVHFRDVQGTVPSFRECFLGEGNFDPVRVMRALLAVGFDGIVMDDHTPQLIGDDAYGYRGRAHAIGYLQGVLAVLSPNGA
jgi:mannonate dehydratase